MKVKTIAVVIVEGGSEKFGQPNFQAAQAYLAAGGATEVESQWQTTETPFVEGEVLDLSLLGIVA